MDFAGLHVCYSTMPNVIDVCQAERDDLSTIRRRYIKQTKVQHGAHCSVAQSCLICKNTHNILDLSHISHCWNIAEIDGWSM